MEISIAGGAYETFSKTLNAQECVNFFTHIDQEGGVSKLSLRGTPGLKSYCNTGAYAEVRGVKRLGRFLYAVVGEKVFRINTNKVATQCTGILNTSSGPVSIDANSTQVGIADGVNLYMVSGTTVTKVTDTSLFSNPITLTVQNEYFIVSFQDSSNFQPSTSGDGSSYDSTIYVTANRKSDYVLAVLSDHGDVIAFGGETMESWYITSNTIPLSRKPGYMQEKGLGARHSPAKLENTVYLLTEDFQIARLQGAQPKVVSPASISYQIAQDSDKANAIGIGAEIEGNSFYILTTSNNTWVYNATTGFCHKLSSYPEPFTGRWRGNCSEYFDDKWIIGDYENGVLYELDFDTLTDNSQPIRRVRVTPNFRKEGKMIFPSMLEIFFEAGVGLDGGVQGSDPQAMLRYSIDGGKTWSNEIWRDIGEIGDYKNRAVWNRFAAGRQYNFELSISDPVKCVVTGANLEATLGVI